MRAAVRRIARSSDRMMLAWQFLGGAVAPVILLQVYGTYPGLALLGAGCATIAAAGVLAGAPSRLLPVVPSPG